MSNVNLPTDTGVGQSWSTTVVKLIPWAKITAPMVPVIFCIFYVGNWLLSLYKFNVLNHVVGGYPPPAHMAWFLVATLLVCGAYLWLSVSHVLRNITSIT